MNIARSKRTVTRVWLLSELNTQLKRLEKEHPDCCGCRVRQIAPLNGLQPANWAADLFETRCEGPCLDHVSEVIGQMQRHCDVAW
jgi:hypothetical protein